MYVSASSLGKKNNVAYPASLGVLLWGKCSKELSIHLCVNFLHILISCCVNQDSPEKWKQQDVPVSTYLYTYIQTLVFLYYSTFLIFLFRHVIRVVVKNSNLKTECLTNSHPEV